MQRVGFLSGNAEGDPQSVASLAALNKALQELGWTDACNMRIDYRWAAADLDRMQALAKELVGLRPDVIVGQNTPVVAALQRETTTIPIAFLPRLTATSPPAAARTGSSRHCRRS